MIETIELRDHLGGSRGTVLRVLLVLGVEVVDRIGHDVPRIHRLPESGWCGKMMIMKMLNFPQVCLK